MLFSLVLECAISRVEANQDGSKLNGTHQVLIYDDDDNIFGGSVHILKKHTEALLVGTKEIGLDVKVDKTKHMGMSRDQNAGRSHSIKTDNSSFENVEQFKYLGTILTNQNSVQEEIKSSLNSGNACYHSVQNLLCSSLLSKNIEIKIYRLIILHVVLYGCEVGCSH